MPVLNIVQGDIFKSNHRHIVFAVNTEGANDAGFAGEVSRRYWPSLATIGNTPMGTVRSKRVDVRTFHAVTCHSLRDQNGWLETPDVVRRALDEIDTEDTIGVVAIGAGMIGAMTGANPEAIIEGMNRSNKNVIVYHL